jgi:hypothetical protein
MSGVARSRSKGELSARIGTYTHRSSGTTYQGGVCPKDFGLCDDVVGNFDGNNPFVLRYTNCDRPIVINGPANSWDFDGCGIFHDYRLPDQSGLSLPVATAKLLSMTHPGRANIQLPVFWSELKDLPRLVQFAGGNLARKGASANLNYQFGWKPLISDLQKLLDFREGVQKRLDELNRLRERGLRRKRTLYESKARSKATFHTRWSSGGVLVHTREYTTYKIHQWGTVRWHPGYALRSMKGPLDKQALKLFLGLDSSQFTSNAWEGLPWSWLIDWFSNVGDLIASQNNRIAFSSDTMIMTHCTAETHVQVLDWTSGVTVNPTSTTIFSERKERAGGILYPSLDVGILSGRQLGILGSLAVLRGRK